MRTKRSFTLLRIPPGLNIIIQGIFTLFWVIIAFIFRDRGELIISFIVWGVAAAYFLIFLWTLVSYLALRKRARLP